MKRSQLILVLVIVALLTVIATNTYYTQVIVLEKYEVTADIYVIESVVHGFNVENTSLNFSTIPFDSLGIRKIELQNHYDHPITIKTDIPRSMEQVLFVEPEKVQLDPGTPVTLVFTAYGNSEFGEKHYYDAVTVIVTK